MRREDPRPRVGELRPSQLLYSFGVGAIVDLPYFSVLVMGLDDWRTDLSEEIGERRLLAAVRAQLGPQVREMRTIPVPPERGGTLVNPFDETPDVGVPVATFPRWMVCPFCRLLAHLGSDLFRRDDSPYRPDETRYVHANCPKPGRPPAVLPARFLVACERGHLDDFPWVWFVHEGATGCNAILRLREHGVSGEAAGVEVRCDACGAVRRMSQAFGDAGDRSMPRCRGRRPHLRDYEPDGCGEQMRTILLGQSDGWFSLTLSALAVPTAADPLARRVEQHWPIVQKLTSPEKVAFAREMGYLASFAEFSDDAVFQAVESRRAELAGEKETASRGLKDLEWEAFSTADPSRNGEDFHLTAVDPPEKHRAWIDRVVLVERLREVRALLGFTRLESPGDFGEASEVPGERRGPLARQPPTWVPATEVRGEGIFLRFDEGAVALWEREHLAPERADEFRRAHREWRRRRGVPEPEAGFPGLRYVMLHSFAHALMRQVALECGYTAASIRERIYALGPGGEAGPMAGVLIYTAAPDSEGTLGGLVRLGRPAELARHIDGALAAARICSSDPLCAEHLPSGSALHGAACHACLFAPETSCERGNRYLDRSLVGETILGRRVGLFSERR